MIVTKYRLDEIATDFRYGSMPKDKFISDSGYPIFSGYRYTGFYEKYNVPKRSIVVVARGVGGTGDVKIAEAKTFLTNLSIAVEINEDIADIDYLYYYMNAQGLRYLDSGAAQSQITINSLKQHKVFLPDIETQKRIAAVLKNYDQLIELNDKRIEILEKTNEQVFREWFVRFRYPGYASDHEGVPEGWEYICVDDLADILQRGISPDYDDDGDLTVISQKCIRKNIMDINEARQQTKPFKKELNLQDVDTLICSTGTGTLGRVGKVVGEYPDTTFDSHVTLVRAKEGISKQFLFGALKNLQIWFMNMGIGSTNQQELYVSVIKKAKILVPDMSMMEKYEQFSKPIHDELKLLIRKKENYLKQRDMVLPRLLSGKLTV